MAVAGMYRRSLPSPPAIDFSSSQGKKLFTEALHKGNMEGFFKLVSHFQTQSEPAYCGLASLAMVLNALAIDPCRKWKGPWRWFDETMLDCCEPLENVKVKGISFGKVICLAHCAGANVKAFRTDQSSIDDFRKYVITCSTSDDCHVISSYNRRVFKQTGTGHFSPIGGYHAESDMLLILDVARFKYPPHWVPLSLLWEAMDTVVGTTGLRRGYLLVSRPRRPPALLYTMSCKHESWIHTAEYLMDDVPKLLSSSDNTKDINHVISTIFSSLPSDFSEFINWVAEHRRDEDIGEAPSQEEKGMLALKKEVLKLVQETSLYKHVTRTLSSQNHVCKMNTLGYTSLLPSTATCCVDTSVRYNKISIDHKRVEKVSERVANGIREQGIDLPVPSSQREPNNYGTFHSSCGGYFSAHSASSDVLTALLLALPSQTWSVIKDERVLKEICGLVSLETLPSLLHDEILHLRSQLLVLKRCKDDMAEYDLDAPLV